MSPEPPKQPVETGLIIQREASLVTLPNGGSPAMSEMINRSLVHLQTSKALDLLHRIGEHDLRDPDYRLVCAWAEELHRSPGEVLDCLLDPSSAEQGDHARPSTILDGRFVDLFVDQGVLEISGLPKIEGLQLLHLRICEPRPWLSPLKPLKNLDLSAAGSLKSLSCFGNAITSLDLSHVPRIETLSCADNALESLDLSHVPRLQILSCADNPLGSIRLENCPNLTELNCSICRLEELDLSEVPRLKVLACSSNWDLNAFYDCSFYARNNNLKTLELKHVPNLLELYCSANLLTHLDLGAIQNLRILSCEANLLSTLDLSANPLLNKLYCEGNPLIELDIRPARELRYLSWRNTGSIRHQDQPRLIQRPEQNFS